MPRVEMEFDTVVPPDQVRAALLDFSERRPSIWPGIEPSLYEVYDVGESSATIKEGTKGPGVLVWAKEHYDWSDPDRVTWTVRESNFCKPGSYVSALITPRDGGSHIHLTWNRTPTTLSGKVSTLLIVATKGRPIVSSFKKGMAKVQESG